MADEPIYGLSTADLEFLKKQLGYLRSLRRNPRVKTFPDDLIESGCIYIARIPNGGIGGLQLQTSGTGSGTGTGTGQDHIDRGPSNYADCTIYKLDESSTAATPNDLVSAGFTERVYNACQGKIYGPQFIPVALDMFGKWYVTSNGRDTEILKVVGVKVAGWQFAYTVDYSVSGDTFTEYDLVKVADPAGGEFAVGDILLDGHLVGLLPPYRHYLASLSMGSSGGTSARWCIAQDGFTAGTTFFSDPHVFPAKFCRRDGTSVTGSTFPVYLENSPYRYPNVEEGNILPIVWNDDRSEWECSVQDDPVGTGKMLIEGIPPQGWVELTDTYPNAAGRFLMFGSSIGEYEGTQDSHLPDYSLTVYPGGEDVSSSCLCVSNTLTSVQVMQCGTAAIPEYTVSDARPPWIQFRFILRYDNKIA